MGKRTMDLALAIPGLIILSPLFLVLAVWIRLDSRGPVFFRQARVGQGGRPFRIFKFRTMVPAAERQGAKLTTAGDPRITRCGRVLRRYKLDELPQLFNVVRGEMSLVGPRPEAPEYVAYYPPHLKEKVLSLPPGITDDASLEFREENDLLADSSDPHRTYIETILPRKLDYYASYVDTRTLGRDLRLVFRTVWAVLGRKPGKGQRRHTSGAEEPSDHRP